MGIKSREDKKLFVLDTNVLMHDPTAIFRFAEHDIFLPMVVLEELDRAKKGTSEVARNVRQVSRFLDETDVRCLQAGHRLPACPCPAPVRCVSMAKTATRIAATCSSRPSCNPNSCRRRCRAISPTTTSSAPPWRWPRWRRTAHVTLVSKDINLRIKAAVIGIHTEDYHNDQVLDDVNLLYSGEAELPADFWDEHSKDMESWQEEGRQPIYRVKGPDTAGWYVNQCLYMESDPPFEAIVRKRTATMRSSRSSTITARANTRSGASARATANRTSPSIC